MKEIEKYIGYYLLVYLVVLAICGFFQYMSLCQGKSLFCAFSMTGINTIITTTAYVLTPIVAIIGFLNWKQQHNKLILADEAKKLLLAINDDIKLFTDIHGTLKAIQNNVLPLKICNEELSIKLQKLSSNIPNVTSKALLLSELANDKKLSQFGIQYSKFMHDFYCESSRYFTDNQPVENIISLINENQNIFVKQNQRYKKLVKKYILAS